MKPRRNIVTFQTPIAICWLEARTLCIVTNNVPRTVENVKEHYQIVMGIIKMKVCWLLDFQTCQNFSSEVAAYVTKELPHICSCLAIIAKTDCEKASAKTFFEFEKLGIPVNMFNNEREARVWLKHLDIKRRSNRVTHI